MSRIRPSHEEELLQQIAHNTHRTTHLLEETNHLLRHIIRLLKNEELPPTPASITFTQRGFTMLDPVAGNTLVYTGTLSPAGSAFPAGTTFTVVSSDPTVTPTVDATGLIVTIPLPSTFVDDPANPFNVTWSTSTFTPSPAGSPASLSAVITPSIPTPPAATPVSVVFNQTT
jgi:hypothetical protein